MPPSMQFRLPPRWLFKFPPDEFPLPIPPPQDARTFASPFQINPDLYVNALDWKVPVTIGALYATTAIFMNKVNRDRGNKPWGFSKAGWFKTFVILHNVFLAVFSALTFVGMLRALAHTWPGREHHLFGKYWPGMRAANGVAGAADALCKMHGPRGFGDAVYFNPTTNLWENKNTLIQMAVGGGPDTSDVGRLWNEGLAFWGWWFYLSKFYEVFDTFIILAKGKRSSTLQTYHHTGAMMCMWAGIRYMSSPIWMFCFLNSAIHTMMYVYYTLSALGIRVPQRIKRTLTTMQISQFIIGITFASMHLFVTYTVPVSTSYTVKSAVDAASSVVSSAFDGPAATATMAGTAAWFKKILFRAAGEEGLAENSLNSHGELFGPEADSIENVRRETRFRPSYETVPCIDTTGQAFAIWLNLAYLAPLTGLFVRFFIRSYSRRGAGSKHPTKRNKAEKAIRDAAHGVDRELDSLGKSAEDFSGDIAKGLKKANGSNGTPQGKKRSETPKGMDKRRVSASIESKWEKFEHGAEETAADIKDMVRSVSRNGSRNGSLRKKTSEGHENLRRMFEQGNVKPAAQQLEQSAEAAIQRMKDVVSVNDDRSSIAEEEEHEQEYPEGRRKSLADELGDANEESWANIKDEDAIESDSQPSASPALEQQNPIDNKENDTAKSERSTSNDGKSPGLSRQNTNSRDPSPKKSKIPQPAKKEASRSRSPAKHAKAASAIPRPSSRGAARVLGTNGTKQVSSTSTPTLSSPTKEKDVGGKGSSSSSAPSVAASERSRSVASSGGDDGAAKENVKTENDTNVKDEQASTTDNADSKEGNSGEEGASVPDKESSPKFEEAKHEDVDVDVVDDVKGKDVESKGEKAEGLSTTDPEEDGATYAEKVKEEGVEG